MISSLQNPLVKQIRLLHLPKGRREHHLFLIEGTHLLETACEVDSSIMTVCFTQQWQEQHLELSEQIAKKAKRVEIVTKEVLSALATTVNPDGVIATVERKSFQSISPKTLRLGLILERLQDPGNLGTIIRTAAATEVEQLWLSSDSVDLDHPKVIRASSGEWFRLPMTVSENLADVIKNYQKQGVQIIATNLNATKLHWEIDYTQPSLIILGNEGAGLSESLTSLADCAVKIPLAGQVESLNVAIATAVILYEARRQQMKV
ncbi:rRNA methyltransferase [Aphanothece hegewaldii CCALA 016]|uniref:rRNA methyltransferase n=1 Tax=Aphanothece hegewaldii CCALA 016 TaxID=2107694 RepID=A0A2T1M1A8_9CHRO|nr:RNA methyltransferase [Aphanothece hegewaldii]PSF38466.1 rRNA methyltransferase [Aphanothece hegewaldii CCALA 016]